ncbi:MAG TPA: ribosome silencing factor [Candidatus Acidoferrum sp.]|nr:ribosome silencing factor [Candidatus Acidoferrum sp.]
MTLTLESLPQGVRLAVQAAQEKKAAGITVLDLSGASAFTDYFVICTGFSPPQVQAICTEIEGQLEQQMGRSVRHREGYRSADWALLDFGGFIVHVFSEEARRYYDLERLWRASPKLEIPDAVEGLAAAEDASAPAFPRDAYSEERLSRRGKGRRSGT